MKIEFTGKYTISSESTTIYFYIIIDNQDITYKVSQEALQDMNPKNHNASLEEIFLSNQSKLEEIIEKKYGIMIAIIL